MNGQLTVSVIGMGRMGGAMARRLSGVGYELTLWNRNPATAQRIAAPLGCHVAENAAAATSKADVVISSLADDNAVRGVYLGSGGVVEGVTPGTVVIDTSTVDPMTSVEVGGAVEHAGGHFLDAPVSGSVSTVDQGTLTVMVGGDAGVLERVRSVFDPLASRVIHTGARGSGTAAKLAVNALVHGLNVALSEALVLAEKAGVDRHTAYEIFANGAGGAPFVHYKRDAFERPDETEVAFSLELVAKDLALITDLGRRVGAPLEQAQVGLGIVQRAIASGMSERDMSAVAVLLREEET